MTTYKYFNTEIQNKATKLSAGQNILFKPTEINIEDNNLLNDKSIILIVKCVEDFYYFYIYSNVKIYQRSSASLIGFNIYSYNNENNKLNFPQILINNNKMQYFYLIKNVKIKNDIKLFNMFFNKPLIQIVEDSLETPAIIPLIRLTENPNIFDSILKITINKEENCLNIYKHIDSKFEIIDNKLSLGFSVIIPANIYYKLFNICSQYKLEPGICDSDYIDLMSIINPDINEINLLINNEKDLINLNINNENNINNKDINLHYGINQNLKYRIPSYILISKFKFNIMLNYTELPDLKDIPYIIGNKIIGSDLHKGFGSTTKS